MSLPQNAVGQSVIVSFHCHTRLLLDKDNYTPKETLNTAITQLRQKNSALYSAYVIGFKIGSVVMTIHINNNTNNTILPL